METTFKQRRAVWQPVPDGCKEQQRYGWGAQSIVYVGPCPVWKTDTFETTKEFLGYRIGIYAEPYKNCGRFTLHALLVGNPRPFAGWNDQLDLYDELKPSSQ